MHECCCTKIHPVYSTVSCEPGIFRGHFHDLKGGELLGTTTQYELFVGYPGSIVACVSSETDFSDYYFDPHMKITGSNVSHYVRGGDSWIAIRKP